MTIQTVTDAIRYVGVDDNTLALFETVSYTHLVGLRLGGGDPRDRRNAAPYPKKAAASGQHRQRKHLSLIHI